MNNPVQLAEPAQQPDSTETPAYQATQYLLRRQTPPWLYYKLRTFTRRYPLLFLPFARWRWTRWRQQYCPDTSGPEPAAPQPFDRHTEIVIEGFPRTANTFTHIAFKMAQTRPVQIGHHTHAVAQVIAAARQHVPTIVLIRDPEDAIISYLVGDFDVQLSIQQSLWEYIHFYEPILPYRDRVIVAPFDQITRDYGLIIRQVNQKFGTQFQEFQHTEANVQRCFDLIDQGYERAFGPLSEKVVSRPAASRQSLKAELQQTVRSDQLAPLRARAYAVYNTLLQSCNTDPLATPT